MMSEEEEPEMVMTCVLCHAKVDANDGFVKMGEQVMCVACGVPLFQKVQEANRQKNGDEKDEQ